MPWQRKRWNELENGEMNQRFDDTLIRYINDPELPVVAPGFCAWAGVEMPDEFEKWPMWKRLEAAIMSGRLNKPAADAKAAETAKETAEQNAKLEAQRAYWESQLQEIAVLAPKAPFLGGVVGGVPTPYRNRPKSRKKTKAPCLILDAPRAYFAD